jgi:flagellar hook-associated protein 1 FlgK
MSLSSSLSTAISGLNVTARRAEIVSSNIANASTPGYAVRSLEVTSQQNGGGVRAVSVTRSTDPILLAQRRSSDAEYQAASARADFHRGLAGAIGQPQDPNSLGASVVRFETALVDAASRPESPAALTEIVNEGQRLATKINAVSSQIGEARQNADTQIGLTVTRLNAALEQVADINKEIIQMTGQGRETASLQDQRQQVIDQIAQEIPLTEVDRGRGQLALYTAGGLALLDGSNVAEFGFSPRAMITPDLSVGAGTLSQLTVNGRDVDALADRSLVGGGRLAALFEVRDEIAPAAQGQIDAVARDFIERFQSASVDPTLATGDAGLFTDSGGNFDPLLELGLAARIAFTPLADPGQGGDISLLRDGLGAAVQGPVGDATQLQRLANALTEGRVTVSGGFTAASRSAAVLTSDLLSMTSVELADQETRESFAASLNQTLRTEELRNGVDTDTEMQQLLVIEQTYAANARIIETISEMLDTLTRL